jgi:hypothetical protein
MAPSCNDQGVSPWAASHEMEVTMSNRRRALLSVSSLVMLAAIGLTGVILLVPNPPVSRRDFDKIQVGMSAEQVQEIFGQPPGWYGSHPASPLLQELIKRHERWKRLGGCYGLEEKREMDRQYRFVAMKDDGWQWETDRGFAIVKFDAERRVVDMEYMDLWPAPEPVFDRLRRWLGL